MTKYILKQNALSDDELFLPSEAKIFKGGYIAILKIHSYYNEWCDRLEIKRFKSEQQLQKYLNKNYPTFNY
jgi:hypothetical protein